MKIVSGSDLQPWFMEPYGTGLVTVSRPYRSDSMLRQVTAFCSKSDENAQFLFTMDLDTPSYPNPDDLPLNGMMIFVDQGDLFVPRSEMNVRYSDDAILRNV